MAPSSFKSFVDVYRHRVRSTPDTEAFSYRQGEDFKTLTWAQVDERVRAIAGGLRALGLQDQQRCGLMAGTRLEWALCDLGIQCAGATTTPVYPGCSADECRAILADSGARFAVAEGDEQVQTLVASREALPALERVITLDGRPGHNGWVIGLAELEEKGRAWLREHSGALDEIALTIQSDWLATLLYTSGTTGEPKGVELTHDNWVYEGEAIDNLGVLSPADTQLLFLPLSHSFAKVLLCAAIRIGVPTAIDGDDSRLLDNLARTRPTFVGGVPRVFEKTYNRVVEQARRSGGLRYRVFRWSLGIGTQVSQLRQRRQEPSGLLAAKHALATRLVFGRLHQAMGGRLRFFLSGGAPLSRDIAEFFHAAGVLICEGYGLTESGAASFANVPGAYRFGTVGRAVPGTEVRIDDSDGEILIRGRGVMQGYHGKPAATAEILDGGWLRTGDIGTLDADGFLTLTDRKKDLIKTSGGKYVAPQKIEHLLRCASPLVSQALVHGDKRNFCTALLTLDEESIRAWAEEHDRADKTYAELSRDPAVVALIQATVNDLNRSLASYESIGRFALLPEELTVDNGALTPNLKVRRRVVEARFKDLLDGFYKGSLTSV